jgi:hypothetical protein
VADPTCGVCKEPKVIPCPCTRAECSLVTHVPFCPTCEPKKLDGWERMQGRKVCNEYVKKQLGR